MEQLTIDTGLREYAVNGGPEHGGGVLRFNPSDPNVYSRFCTLQISCKSWNSRCRRKAPLGPMPYSCWPRRISAPRGCWRKVLGPGNDFDATLGGTNLLAVAGNGERVITNLFAALQPILEAGARQCADAKATLAVQQAQAARAARGVQV